MSSLREVIFEVSHVGLYKKVTAIDVLAGIETSFVGPKSSPFPVMQEMARRKLMRLLS